MRRRDRVKPHHPHPHHPEKRRRKQRRRRSLHSMLLAGAALVAPSAVRPPLAGPSLSAPEAITRTVTPSKGMVTTSEAFRLPPESAFEGLIDEAAKRFRLAPAAEMGVADAFDPRENIMAGAEYLSTPIAEQDGDIALALASYNAGPGAVERYGGIPPFKETQRYVKTILDHIARSEVGDQ